MHMGALISWRSKKQNCVAFSLTELESITLSETCQEVVYIKQLIYDFDGSLSKTGIFEDNQSCFKMLDFEKVSHHTKHIDIKYH